MSAYAKNMSTGENQETNIDENGNAAKNPAT